MKNLLIATTVLACLAGVASAQLTVSVVNQGDGVYEIVLDGVGVTAFEGDFVGTFVQQKAYDAPIDTPDLEFVDVAGTLVTSTNDTHFNFLPDELLAVAGPYETANTLGGTFGIAPAAQGTPLSLATINLGSDQGELFFSPNGAGGTFDVNATVADASGAEYEMVGTFVVPEPATMSLLGLGGLAVLRRRRKA